MRLVRGPWSDSLGFGGGHVIISRPTMANTRRGVLTRHLEARAETDSLFRMIRPDAMYDRPIPERHRVIFYVGHLEAFDWNLLSGICGLGSHNLEFDRLFAFGIDPVGRDLPDDGPQDWPPLEEVTGYGERTRQALDGVLEAAEMPEEGEGSFGQLLNIAIEHRLMHAETLAYMFHQMPLERKQGSEGRRALEAGPVAPEAIHIPTGLATLGQRRDSGAFGWDNEFEAHAARVPEFTIDRYKVTNAQFQRFQIEGGYDDRTLWDERGWEWKTAGGIAHPAFWVRRGESWAYRTMFTEIPLPPDWPVYVSHAEASAYARWAGRALPTEAEWHRAAYGTPGDGEREYPWGDAPMSTADGDPPADLWDPAPVQASRLGRSAFGVNGLVANGWEWTSTEFAPFPGFRPLKHYGGYSAPFFDGQHYVLKGGSRRTSACMLRRSFRNWFQPHYQYVYAGFRCVSRH